MKFQTIFALAALLATTVETVKVESAPAEVEDDEELLEFSPFGDDNEVELEEEATEENPEDFENAQVSVGRYHCTRQYRWKHHVRRIRKITCCKTYKMNGRRFRNCRHKIYH